MKIAITGHRPNKLDNDYDLIGPLSTWIRGLIISHVQTIVDNSDKQVTLISGMALGIDQLFAQIAIDMGLPFIAAIPFSSQPIRWPIKSQRRYDELIRQASEVVNVSGKSEYQIEYMQLRNMWMVDNCDVLIAVWDGTSGGTANCVRYATGKKRIIHINPKEYGNQGTSQPIKH